MAVKLVYRQWQINLAKENLPKIKQSLEQLIDDVTRVGLVDAMGTSRLVEPGPGDVMILYASVLPAITSALSHTERMADRYGHQMIELRSRSEVVYDMALRRKQSGDKGPLYVHPDDVRQLAARRLNRVRLLLEDPLGREDLAPYNLARNMCLDRLCSHLQRLSDGQPLTRYYSTYERLAGLATGPAGRSLTI